MKNWIDNNNQSDIVLSSKVALSRNFNNIPFPNKLNYIKGRECGRNIYNILSDKNDPKKLNLHEIWNGNNELNLEYMEKNLISDELLKNTDKGAFIINRDETMSIMINENDHIIIQCITSGLNLDEVFNNAMDIDDRIEKFFDYAFDEKLGYLTTSLEKLGTGMRASIITHLPALTMSEEIKNVQKNINKMGIQIKSVYLDGAKPFGNMYEIFNNVSLGITEEKILSNLKDATINIVSQEKKFREVLLSKCKYELQDKIYRSYGILKSAVLLDYKEAVELLSKLRLGTELSVIDIDKEKLNQLLVMITDSSIQNNLGKALTLKEIRYQRAKLIKEILI